MQGGRKERHVRGVPARCPLQARQCGSLATLSLAWCTKLTDAGLAPLFQANPGLQVQAAFTSAHACAGAHASHLAHFLHCLGYPAAALPSSTTHIRPNLCRLWQAYGPL
jgi:hypothetical protein